MNDDAAVRLTERITELETLFLHLQRGVADLDEALRGQMKRLDGFDRQLARLSARVESLSERDVEIRRPEDEVPPHY